MYYPGAGVAIMEVEGIKKHTVICAETHGLHFLVHKGFNMLPGCLKVLSQRCRLMITLQMVLVSGRMLPIAPCIRGRSIFNPWISMAHMYNNSKDRL